MTAAIDVDCTELQRRLKANPDFGLALLRDGHVPVGDLLPELNRGGVPFLSLADGPLGILRALAVRMGRGAYVEGAFTLVAAKVVDGVVVLFHWHLNGSYSR